MNGPPSRRRLTKRALDIGRLRMSIALARRPCTAAELVAVSELPPGEAAEELLRLVSTGHLEVSDGALSIRGWQ